MKIKVTPEGREGVWNIEKEEAIKAVNNYKDKMIHNFIHNFIPGGPAVIGADWQKDSVIETINESERIAVLTGSSLKHNMNHALAVIVKNSLYMFDIGDVKESDLEIAI